jgi:plasmid maintenance system antidote protein VapI
MLRRRKKSREMLIAEETLILEVTEAISEQLNELGLNRNNLADRLGIGKSAVSQLLAGDRNLTLRSAADMAHVLHCKIKVELVGPGEESG